MSVEHRDDIQREIKAIESCMYALDGLSPEVARRVVGYLMRVVDPGIGREVRPSQKPQLLTEEPS